jgi:hypothetical protein
MVWAGKSGVWILAERIFFSQNFPHHLWGPHSPHLSGYLGYFLEVKRPGDDVHYSPPHNTSIVKEWIYTPLLQYAFKV